MSEDRQTADAAALLSRIAARCSAAPLASSFGAEDMVLIDVIAKRGLAIAIFTPASGPVEVGVRVEHTGAVS